MAPGWTNGYVTTGNVTPITSLEVDQGRLTASGKPEDADDPVNFRPALLHPGGRRGRMPSPRSCAPTGIRVLGRRCRQPTAPKGAATIASVHSPCLSAIVGWMLRESNNVIAENLARQVALRTGRPASFAGGGGGGHGGRGPARRRQRHPPGGRQRPVPAGPDHPDGAGRPRPRGGRRRQAALRAAITGMPVAGFSGTLAPGPERVRQLRAGRARDWCGPRRAT